MKILDASHRISDSNIWWTGDWQVTADVTAGSDKLVEAIDDAEAVVCATGFRPSWDIFAPWKVSSLFGKSLYAIYSRLQ